MLSSENDYKESLDELQRIVSEGNKFAIDKWFNDYSFDKNSIEAHQFAKSMAKRHYFFSFRSPLNTSKAFFDEQSIIRETAVLKHFALKSQLEILASLYISDEVKLEHIRVLDYSLNKPEDKEIIDKSQILDVIWMTFFSKEKFKDFEEIQSILGFSLIDKECSLAHILYKGKNISGAITVILGDKVYKPYFDIIFNYTETKKKYILDLGLSLPNIKESEDLLALVREKIEKDPYFNRKDNLDMLHDKTRQYLKCTRYESLTKMIVEKNNNKEKRLKI